jgi:hypothetical protein
MEFAQANRVGVSVISPVAAGALGLLRQVWYGY